MILPPRSVQESHLLGNRSGKVSATLHRNLKKVFNNDTIIMSAPIVLNSDSPFPAAPRHEDAWHRSVPPLGGAGLPAGWPLGGFRAVLQNVTDASHMYKISGGEIM